MTTSGARPSRRIGASGIGVRLMARQCLGNRERERANIAPAKEAPTAKDADATRPRRATRKRADQDNGRALAAVLVRALSRRPARPGGVNVFRGWRFPGPRALGFHARWQPDVCGKAPPRVARRQEASDLRTLHMQRISKSKYPLPRKWQSCRHTESMTA